MRTEMEEKVKLYEGRLQKHESEIEQIKEKLSSIQSSKDLEEKLLNVIEK